MPDAAVPAAGALRLRRGRALAFSPAWSAEGASVVFDRNSGDYWIVSPLARAILLAVSGEPPAADASGAARGPEEAASVIHELVRQGILAQT